MHSALEAGTRDPRKHCSSVNLAIHFYRLATSSLVCRRALDTRCRCRSRDPFKNWIDRHGKLMVSQADCFLVQDTENTKNILIYVVAESIRLISSEKITCIFSL